MGYHLLLPWLGAYMRVCVTHAYTHKHMHTHKYTHMHTHAHKHMHTHMHTHVHTHMCTHTRTWCMGCTVCASGCVFLLDLNAHVSVMCGCLIHMCVSRMHNYTWVWSTTPTDCMQIAARRSIVMCFLPVLTRRWSVGIQWTQVG